MHVKDFHKLSLEKRINEIKRHEWILGEELSDCGIDQEIGYGNAVMSFYREILEGTDNFQFPLILSKLDSDDYCHCVDCGYLFRFSEDRDYGSKIGYFAKSLDGVAKAFSIDSGICTDCFEVHMERRKKQKAKTCH